MTPKCFENKHVQKSCDFEISPLLFSREYGMSNLYNNLAKCEIQPVMTSRTEENQSSKLNVEAAFSWIYKSMT